VIQVAHAASSGGPASAANCSHGDVSTTLRLSHRELSNSICKRELLLTSCQTLSILPLVNFSPTLPPYYYLSTSYSLVLLRDEVYGTFPTYLPLNILFYGHVGGGPCNAYVSKRPPLSGSMFRFCPLSPT
jgi:hypothetical protein